MGIFPKWVQELKWSDFWGGVKQDIAKGAKTVQTSAKAVMKGATSALTPTVIWLVVLVIIGLVLFAWFKKILKV